MSSESSLNSRVTSKSSVELKSRDSFSTTSKDVTPHASISDIFSNAYIPLVINYSNEFDDFFRETERMLLTCTEFVTEAYHLLTFVDDSRLRSNTKLRAAAFFISFALDSLPISKILDGPIQSNLFLFAQELNSLSNCAQVFYEKISIFDKIFQRCRKTPRSWRTRRKKSNNACKPETEWKKPSRHLFPGLDDSFSFVLNGSRSSASTIAPKGKKEGWGKWKLFEKPDTATADQDPDEGDDKPLEDITSSTKSLYAVQDILYKTRKLVALSHALLLQGQRSFHGNSSTINTFSDRWNSSHYSFKLADERSYYQWIIKITPLTKVLTFLISNIQETIFLGNDVLTLMASLTIASINLSSSKRLLSKGHVPRKMVRRLYKFAIQLGIKRTTLKSPQLIRHEICKAFRRFVWKAEVDAIPLITDSHMYFLSIQCLYNESQLYADDPLEKLGLLDFKDDIQCVIGDFRAEEPENDENQNELPVSCKSPYNSEKDLLNFKVPNMEIVTQNVEIFSTSTIENQNDVFHDDFTNVNILDQEGNVVDTFPPKVNNVDLDPGLIYIDTRDKSFPQSAPNVFSINHLNVSGMNSTQSIQGSSSGNVPRTASRHKRTAEEISVINKGLTKNLGGVPDRYREHRRSSIPFANRAPRVRFLKTIQPYSNNDVGPFKPAIVQLPPPPAKTILKKTDFPIIIDLSSIESETSTGSTYKTTNDVIISCTAYTEQVIQVLSSADRETRGCIDILTFPVTTSASDPIEALARFQCSLILGIMAIEAFKTLKPNFGDDMDEIIELAEGLVKDLNKIKRESKSLLKKVNYRYSQWEKLLNHKGEFKITQRRSIVPIYSRQPMPENVTLYENDVQDDPRFRNDGVIRCYRTAQELIIVFDAFDSTFTKYQNELDYNRTIHIVWTAIEHAQQLIFYANKRLETALSILKSPLFEEEFNGLKKKIWNMEFDAFYDPLIALELKNTLGDVVSRKGELLNTAQHVEKYVKWMLKLAKMFLKYCKQTGSEYSTKKGMKPCCGKVTAQNLYSQMTALRNMDFMISIPLTDNFIKVFLNTELDPKLLKQMSDDNK